MPPQHTPVSTEAAAGFNWRQSYDENDFSRHFLNNYGWVMLAGDGGLIRAEGLLITLLMLGPGAIYPRHSHAAEEIYQIIAGEVEIDTGDMGWQHYTPGMTCHHIPWVPHALRCGATPVIMMAIWKADRFIKSRIEPSRLKKPDGLAFSAKFLCQKGSVFARLNFIFFRVPLSCQFPTAAATHRLGVDIGGTFTDVVLETPEGRFSTKVLTTYAAPEDAIIEGMHRVTAKAGIAAKDIGQIIHGTTLATNALIERRGAKTALITTEGFRDVIEMRTESRFEQYDLNLVLPEPLLPRNRRYVIRERIDAQGRILIDLDRNEIEALAERLAKGAYESIAIGLLHAYANDTHERMIADVLAEKMPDVMISLSSEVSPQMREYERFNTTIANAYIKPLMKSYLMRLRQGLAAEGADCPIFLMHSGGGIMALESAAEFPLCGWLNPALLAARFLPPTSLPVMALIVCSALIWAERQPRSV